jgi:hypothetical protein
VKRYHVKLLALGKPLPFEKMTIRLSKPRVTPVDESNDHVGSGGASAQPMLILNGLA